jgi:ABC-type branched-subunit amino acid transport system ATPase component
LTDILRLENITKSFDGLKAIDSLDMRIEGGKISTIIGPNGAGKTTLFNIICGYLYQDTGRITYKDKDISTLNPWERASLGIGRLFQDIRVFKKLTLLENLLVTFNDNSENPLKAIFGKRNGKEKEKIEIAFKWLEFVSLSDRKESLAESLSWGQQKLLSLARLLCGKFDLLLIDEPVSGVNPDMVEVILEKIKGLKRLGKTIVAVEHDMDVIKTVSDYVYFMDSGKITASGSPEEILSNQGIMETYIGI